MKTYLEFARISKISVFFASGYPGMVPYIMEIYDAKQGGGGGGAKEDREGCEDFIV